MSRGKITEQELEDKFKNRLAGFQDGMELLTKEKSNKDTSGIYTTITYRRKRDGSLYATSVLSGGTSPNFTTRTITRFSTDGQTVISTSTFLLSYDADDNLVSEV